MIAPIESREWRTEVLSPSGIDNNAGGERRILLEEAGRRCLSPITAKRKDEMSINALRMSCDMKFKSTSQLGRSITHFYGTPNQRAMSSLLRPN